MTLLHIDSSILGPNSVSRQLSAAAVAGLKAAGSQADIIYRDLAAEPISHLSGAYLSAAQSAGGEHEEAVATDLAQGFSALQEFLAADTVVIGVAVYNFSIPSQLKAWVDRIVIAGQTFQYGAQGRPEGLVSGKRVILTVARGGFYGPGTPTESFEHAETYLRTIFGFIGIVPEVVVAEGLAAGPEHRKAGIASAQHRISALAA
jgi:FMN-dependent NADH-azoreductase